MMSYLTSSQGAIQIAGTLINCKDATSYYYLKRFIDLVLATSLLLLLSPIFLVIAILIKYDSPGPIFFRQERIGSKRQNKNGQLGWVIQNFKMYKFRSMRVDVSSELHQRFMEAYINGDKAAMNGLQHGSDAAKSFKLTNDPRVTRVGQFIRKTSLDELPQLWNVVKGDMSLVGPRPPISYEVKMYSPKDFHRLGTTVGITGLWQVSGRADTSFEDMIQLDLEYIERQSIWLDLKILILTLPAVISGRGAG